MDKNCKVILIGTSGWFGKSFVIVHIDPEQIYFPKISSRVTASGSYV